MKNSMTASNQPARSLLHTRQVTCTAYQRSDGMVDIEGRMQDTKAGDMRTPFKQLHAGDTLHLMRMIMTIDHKMTIHHIEAHTDAGPTPFCADINAAYSALEGLKIGPGFKQQVKSRVGGRMGCTHLSDLLGPMATTAMQALMPLWMEEEMQRVVSDPAYRMAKPWIIDTCHAYRSDGEAVRSVMPDFYRSADECK
ncbi:Protein of unknown function [Collimonas sp. OK307]|uniref:DUF2889 domain-containing protein n=1 Tax=Collimonas sp. OK307 TaxID=1801620 RepID=UPI0008E85B5A|nr:DUF2889 domain-containing protein [Collimonas sp. OK307]SFI00424.1 Protein of unknown function [Collimonas sp. OK307]